MAEMGQGLTPQMVQRLQEELDQSRVKTRKERNETLSYLEAWDVIDTANDIFGFDQWAMHVRDVDIGKLGVRATVELNVRGVVRQDVGFNAYAVAGDNPPTKKAMDTSLKGAVSDAMKRAFRTFGAQFGNTLYDKESDNRAENQGRRRNRQSDGSQKNQQRRRANGVGTDDSGGEVLTGRALAFKEYVERHVSWPSFLSEVLEVETLQDYFDSGGSPTGAVDAFRQYAADLGIEVE